MLEQDRKSEEIKKEVVNGKESFLQKNILKIVSIINCFLVIVLFGCFFIIIQSLYTGSPSLYLPVLNSIEYDKRLFGYILAILFLMGNICLVISLNISYASEAKYRKTSYVFTWLSSILLAFSTLTMPLVIEKLNYLNDPHYVSMVFTVAGLILQSFSQNLKNENQILSKYLDNTSVVSIVFGAIIFWF